MKKSIFDEMLEETNKQLGLISSNAGLADTHQELMLERKSRRESRNEMQIKIAE